ncbi:MAG: DHH family phosphoesterase [Candidatus Latescibacterota bacterium]|nr:MAG: DHH family phosphoesterase [Candidatus Latescibacterota bacterium]
MRLARSRLRRLGKVLEDGGETLVASHNNPDPDSIVSALLLKSLITTMTDLPVTVTYSGVVGRAENEALLKYSEARFYHLRDIDIGRFDTIALVDTQPGTGNNPFGTSSNVRIVFDHHRLAPQTKAVPFHDVREYLGTTTTLLYLYCRAAGLPLTRRYATLMHYALRSETSDMGREASEVDRRIFKDLFGLADLRAVSRIVNAKVGQSYFSAVHEAIEHSRVYGNLIVTQMATVPYPDAVAQIAEYFLKYRDVTCSFSMGIYGDEILLSLRSDDPGARLGLVAGRIVEGFGTAGGHGAIAGGQISVAGKHPSRIDAIEKTVIDRLLKELDLEDKRPRRLLRHPSE